ncbi:MAG: thioredoxin domain-containing protein [Opitutales bacterium]
MKQDTSGLQTIRFVMANRLARESSLYLRQHRDNPVDWWPWCEEALALAQKKNKPLLVSIGYSACHWCHVMAHECFEDDYIAGLMNEHFVCIKVDREERPDVDQIYMEAVQMLTQRGGWPLNVFCFPDGRPFFGGTYFPPDDRGQGLVPWPQLLMRIADAWKRQPDELRGNAEAIVNNMHHLNDAGIDPDTRWDPRVLVAAAETVCKEHDDTHGGFGTAPKFPPAMTLNFLLGVRGTASVEQRKPDQAKRIDCVVNTTLKAMAHGGIYDQVAGGFARYSVDTWWLIPHFEKMLYDNGQLIDVYTRAWYRYREPLYAAVVEESIGWLQREMQHPEGAFFASLDADSEGEEGKFTCWTPGQVKAVLGEADGDRFCRAYGISEEGNFEHGLSNPALGVDSFGERQALAPLREKLLRAREERVRPGCDTKILVSWNALALRGLAEAAFAFGRADWMETARRAADWIWDQCVDSENRLSPVWYDEGGARGEGLLADYAGLAEALLVLAGRLAPFQPEAIERCRERAGTLIDTVLNHFCDDEKPGYFVRPDDGEALVARKKEWFDNAVPSGNACLVSALAGLFALTGETRYSQALARLRTPYASLAARAPAAIGHALDAWVQEATGLVVIKGKGIPDWELLRRSLVQRPWRRLFLLPADADAEQPEGFQVCVGTTCLEPTGDPEDAANRL